MNDEKINEDIYKKNKRNITIILTIILLVLIVIMLIAPIQKHFAKINLVKEISTEVLKDIEYNDYKIEGEYFNNLNVQMKDNFENYDYSKKKEIRVEVLNRFTNIFNNYKKILIGGSSNNTEEKENKAKVVLICKGNRYTIDKEFIKNGETYTEEESLKENIIQQLNDNNSNNKDELISIIQDMQCDKEILKKIIKIQDINEKTNEIIYQEALNLYNNGEFKEALEKFNSVKDYSDSTDKINQLTILEEYQGTWEETGNRIYRNKVIISKWKIYFLLANVDQKSTYDYSFVYTYDYKLDGNELKRFYSDSNDFLKYNYYLKEGTLYCPHDSLKDSITELKKISEDITPPKIVNVESPKIGMTKTEVEKSTWGKPNKINRTRTSYGTHEQWCYNNNKYIYFEDGIVTSIQD